MYYTYMYKYIYYLFTCYLFLLPLIVPETKACV